MRKARPLLPLLLAMAVALAVAAPAHAGAGQESIFQDDAALLHSGAEVRESTLDELQGHGVDAIRVLAMWSDHSPAPTSTSRPEFDASDPDAYPAGTWDRLDGLVQSASAHGIEVLLNPSGPIPAWASECSGSVTERRICRPDPQEFGRFVTALGRRYAGVRRWSVWNEPNHGAWLTPQYSRKGSSMVPEGPTRYRRLFEAAEGALAATGHGGDQLLLGETAPVARTSRSWATRTIGPADFYKELFCLDSRGRALTGTTARNRGCTGYRKLAATGVAHHPYGRSAAADPRASTSSSADVTMGTLSRLTTWLDRGGARGRIRRGMPVYLTEYGIQTNPPDRTVGVPLSSQATWLNESDWMAFGNSRVRSVGQYVLRDEPDLGTFQTGLRFNDGRAKPSLDAYRVPIWIVGTRSYTKVWGQVRAAPDGVPQEIEVQYASGSRGPWKRLKTMTVSGGRSFVYFRTSRRASYWRLTWDGRTSRVAKPDSR